MFDICNICLIFTIVFLKFLLFYGKVFKSWIGTSIFVVISCWLYLDVVSFIMKFYYNIIYFYSLDLIDLFLVFNFLFGLKYNYDFFVYIVFLLLSELIFLLDIKLCNYFVKIIKLILLVCFNRSGKLYF